MNRIILSSDFGIYNPRVEPASQMKESIFYDVYLNAEKCVKDIIEQAEKYDPKFFTDCNNIIAFTGDRGSGKTSAMMSFAGALRSKQSMLDDKGWAENKFECLPIIDPSNLTENETVMDVVLSQLYTMFNKSCENFCEGKGPVVSIEQKREVYLTFQKAHKAIRAFCQSRSARHEDADSLEALSHIAAGNELRVIMYKLIQSYLNAVNPNGSRPFLVLSVDDLDMNIASGYAICEELRKYFSLPNVIILFSLKIEQMDDVIQLEYTSLFKGNEPSTTSIPEMSAKYLGKVLPFSRCCSLPSFHLNNIGSVTVQYEEGEVNVPPLLLVDELLKLVFDKTGVILVKDKYGYHSFIPTTLREIIHLWAMLKEMEGVAFLEPPTVNKAQKHRIHRLSDKEKVILSRNIETLERYLHERSAASLPGKLKKTLRQISTEPLVSLNKKLTGRLYTHILVQAPTYEIDDTIEDIISYDTQLENISIGDVLYMLRQYSQVTFAHDKHSALFTTLFRMLYSFRLLSVLRINGIDTDGELGNISTNKDNLRALLGGLIYAPDQEKIVQRPTWYIDAKLETLSAGNHGEDVYDMVLMHTMLFKSLINIPFEMKINNIPFHFPLFRAELDEAYYNDVTRERLKGAYGNTNKYFSLDYLSCITNCLSSQVNIESDQYKKDYEDWLSQYISVIPVFSVDFIDAYTSELRATTSNMRKSGMEGYQAFASGSKKLISQIATRTALDECTTIWIASAANEFPFWQEVGTLREFPFFDTEKTQNNTEAPKPNLSKNLPSLRLTLRKIQNAIAKYTAAKIIEDMDSFKKLRGVSRNGETLTALDIQYLKELDDKIKEIKQSPYNRRKTDIGRMISSIISTLESAAFEVRSMIELVETGKLEEQGDA